MNGSSLLEPSGSKSAPAISLVLCTHNPRPEFLNRVLASVVEQSLPADQWELVMVDSASEPPIRQRRELNVPVETRIIRLNEPGLALARKAGIEAARGALLATLDDDTVLDRDYLRHACEFLNRHPEVGACSGRFSPEFGAPPPDWIREFEGILAIRNLGSETIIQPGLKAGEKLAGFPPSAPVGVNVSRRSAYQSYLARWESETTHAVLGRRGRSLASGEDNDYALCCLEDGWSLAYVPELSVTHLIPPSRFAVSYLAALCRASTRSWVQVLALHELHPYPPISRWTAPLRQMKAWFVQQAWRGSVAYIRWQACCGQIEGRAWLSTRQSRP